MKVHVNGTDYEEQVLDGNVVLVPVKEQAKVMLELTKPEAEALYDILSTVRHDDFCDTTRPRWEDRAMDEFCEFSDRAEELAQGISERLRYDAVDNDYETVSGNWEHHIVVISEKREKVRTP